MREQVIARKSLAETTASVAAISGLSRAALVKHWIATHGQSPPTGLSRRLLEYAVAYQIQAKACGGLSNTTKKILLQAARPADASTPGRPTKPLNKRLGPGTRIVREWHGRIYTVDVLDKGYGHEGRTYRSLSEIARTITGVRWSGPRFFSP